MNADSIESGSPARFDNSTLPTDSSASSFYGIGKVFHLDDKLVFGIAIALLVAAFLFLVLTCCCCIRLRRQHRKPKKYGLLATSEREADFLNSGMNYDYDDEEENHTLFVNSRSKQTNEPTQKLVNRSIFAAAAAASDEDYFVENRWCQLPDRVHSTALAVLSRASRQHQDWFDDNDAVTSNLLVENSRLNKVHVNRPTDDKNPAFYRSRCLVQQRLREMQEAWMARKADEIQGWMDEWKNFFAVIRAVYDLAAKGTAHFLSADGSTLFTEMTPIFQRWAEHFRGVLNRPCRL
nr:unnamed protein product [Spirometra erinaceieuropaei]